MRVEIECGKAPEEEAKVCRSSFLTKRFLILRTLSSNITKHSVVCSVEEGTVTMMRCTADPAPAKDGAQVGKAGLPMGPCVHFLSILLVLEDDGGDVVCNLE
jgi:hypothetical protein